MSAETIIYNAKIATNASPSFVEAIAIEGGNVSATGNSDKMLRLASPATTIIDAKGRTVIPGLNDSHMHPIRGGLNYNMELRWDGVPSLADALRMLKEQAARTPGPQWVRVIGGWSEFQFAERRMPTLDEINAVAPDTPVFVLHLYDRALLNGAALRAVGYTKDTPDPQAGEIQRDKKGNPTGILIAKPNSYILYSSIFKGPKLSREDQLNSSRLFFRELNRFGITSVVDAGGGFQNYPDDYEVVNELHQANQLTIRLASLTSAFSAMLRVLQCVALAGLLDVVSLMIDATVRRIWHAHGLKPHLSRSFKVSNDPEFAEKLADVVGLYLNPPEHAIVLRVDEKSQIQALDRTQPGLPIKKGRCGTMTHDYKRNGTATLFAALDTLDGRVISMCDDRHRHQEWLRFLRIIDKLTPKDKQVHLIVD
jgi:hypothetical protein